MVFCHIHRLTIQAIAQMQHHKQPIVTDILTAANKLHNQNDVQTPIQVIHRLCDIPGNDRADKLARQEPLRYNTTNKSPTLHPSRSYKWSLGRFGMTGGLVATLDGSTTSTNKLQTRHTLSTNYTEHIRLPYFVSEHTMLRWTHTYIASRKNTQQSVYTAPTVMRPLNISCSTAHCTTTSDPDYCQLNQIYTTRYVDPLHNCNEQPPTTYQPWTDVTRLSEVWRTKKGKR